MGTVELHGQHERAFADNRYVYPVLSRRSAGISVGINLNPDKVCNFDCIYCQVDRTREAETRFVDMERLVEELDRMLKVVSSGQIFRSAKFRSCPSALRRFSDIAFSGDGEPTTYTNFDQIVDQCAQRKRDRGLDGVKMVLITNASMFHRPHVQRALEILDANDGEIWAKLEAGTEDYFRRVERTRIPFRQILDNIQAAAQLRPIVIQALFMRIKDLPPPATELHAFCDRLNDITSRGGQLSHVQVYTVARTPAEDYVSPLGDDEIDSIVDMIRQRTGLSAVGFYGVPS